MARGDVVLESKRLQIGKIEWLVNKRWGGKDTTSLQNTTRAPQQPKWCAMSQRKISQYHYNAMMMLI
jgi:hypothetical protein